MKPIYQKAPVGTRGVAFTSDYFICIFVSLIVISILTLIRNEVHIFRFLGIHPIYLSSTPIIAVLILFKDFGAGKSLGKRWTKIMVRDYHDPTKLPDWGRLVLRNVTLLVWPVEYFFMLIHPERRRMGDIIAGTDVYLMEN